ncbi:MAG: riboflavin biosynthesis protein RibF [Candidatus Eremiobacteraeota bacterium]|nr:riboflavin biosynthesis protein RibF [Candidatus Eremiobacteraeota bacterium]MBC5826182.1 riboflavin biosynthesis protein RibF [Candidatus Eremiobacteraeota bacterium]
MQIVRSIDGYRASDGLLLTIGVFDGVHIGHRAVLARLLARRTAGVLTAAMTFERHPQAFLNPDRAPKSITTVDEKVNLLDACGLDVLFLLQFDERIQTLAAQTFLEDILLQRLHTRMLVVGDRWRFGKDRAGDGELAEPVLRSAGCGFEATPLLERDGEKVSSSRIRQLIEARAFEKADELLGSPYVVRGIVKAGEGRGHLLGWPTANIETAACKLVPTAGVYAASARYDGRDFKAVVSIGDKPTFGGTENVIEAYLLGFDGSIYGEQLSLRAWRFLRGQERFDDGRALAEQIQRDVDRARI